MSRLIFQRVEQRRRGDEVGVVRRFGLRRTRYVAVQVRDGLTVWVLELT